MAVVHKIQLWRPFVEPHIKSSRMFLDRLLFLRQALTIGWLIRRFFRSPHGRLIDLPPEIHQQQFWFFEFGEDLLGFVDLIFEIDAAVVESLRLVHAGILKHIPQSARRIPPQQAGSVGFV